jgi:hypothetical protein
MRLAAALALALSGACSRGAVPDERGRPTGDPATAGVPAPVVLAEGVLDAPRIRVQVIDVTRAGEQILVTLALSTAGTAQVVDIGTAFADPATGGAGTLSGVCLVDETGRRKALILRDGAGKPMCSTALGPIPPGGRVEAWARFPAPGLPGARRVTVQIPGLAPFRDLPISDGPGGTGRTGPS